MLYLLVVGLCTWAGWHFAVDVPKIEMAIYGFAGGNILYFIGWVMFSKSGSPSSSSRSSGFDSWDFDSFDND